MNLVKDAIAYFDAGMEVIPINPRNKTPMISWTKFPLNTKEKVINFWNQNPNAAIALRTKSFFVVDVDMGHSEGVDGLESIRRLGYPEWFSETLAQQTGNGGLHYFFIKPQGIQLSQKIGILPGVDIKANDNNYVIVAPSVINGKHYHWINNNSMMIPCDELLKFISDNNVRNLSAEKIKTNNHNCYSSSISKSGTAFSRYAPLIAHGLGEKGTRNNNLYSFISYMLGPAKVKASVAYDLAVHANSMTEQPLKDDELNKTFVSCLKRNNLIK